MIEEKATALMKILQEHYDSWKYHQHFTPWGAAYYWNQDKGCFNEHADTHGLGQVISGIFSIARKRGVEVHKPSLYFPRAKEVLHYSTLCMRNRDLVTALLVELSGSSCDADILSDSRLFTEALTTYGSAIASGGIPATTKLIGFLLQYRGGCLRQSAGGFDGQYLPLLERSDIRFEGKDFFAGLQALVQPDVYEKALLLDRTADELGAICLDPCIVEAYQNNLKGRKKKEIPEAPKKKSLSSILGPIRSRVGSNGTFEFDFEAWRAALERRNKCISLNPNDVVRAWTLNEMVIDAVESYRKIGIRVVEELSRRAEQSRNEEEQKALYTTIKFIQYIGYFDDAETIHHSMSIIKKQDNHEKST